MSSNGKLPGLPWDAWRASEDDVPFSGEAKEVALLSRLTGKSAVQVRLAIMKVGTDRAAVIAELAKTKS